jgi:hypothetical protein
MDWDITVFPDQPPYRLKGTVQSVMAQAELINPNFKTTFNFTESTEPSEPSEDSSGCAYRDPKGIVRRNEEQKRCTGCTWACMPPAAQFRIMCLNKFHELGHPKAIVAAIPYLRHVPGKPSNGPGPMNCGRISCSLDTGIFWCNNVSAVVLKTWF